MKLHSCDICQEKFAVGTEFIKHIDTKHAQTIFVDSETIKEEDIKEEIEESNAEDPLSFQEIVGDTEGEFLIQSTYLPQNNNNTKSTTSLFGLFFYRIFLLKLKINLRWDRKIKCSRYWYNKLNFVLSGFILFWCTNEMNTYKEFEFFVF